MDNRLTDIADRLTAKLKGYKQQELVQEDDGLIELADAHLDMISAAYCSLHMSCTGNVCQTTPSAEANLSTVSSSSAR